MPETAKNREFGSNNMKNLEKIASYQNLVMSKIFKSITPNDKNNRNQKFLIKPEHQLTKNKRLPSSNKAKSLTEIEEYVFNIINSRKNKDERYKLPENLEESLQDITITDLLAVSK